MINLTQVSNALTERFGLDVTVTMEKVSEGQKIIIRPNGVEYTISFQVEIILGWRTITAQFEPGTFALDLVRSMSYATKEQKSAFSVFADSLKSKRAKVDLLLDRKSYDVTKPESWSGDWSNIIIRMKKVGLILEKKSGYDFEIAFPWLTGFFGMTLALLPLEEIPDEEISGEKEGSYYYELVKRYERSRINRAACIEIQGTSCKICGFCFGDFFGDFGEGFIHVHHIVPVSEMKESYILNPGTDLIPVCPNCHAMFHRKKPPLLPETLKKMFKE